MLSNKNKRLHIKGGIEINANHHTIKCFDNCEHHSLTPTQYRLAKWLSVAPQTITNYKYKKCNGRSYTTNPAPSRIIDNSDMEIITAAIDKINERNN